MIVLQRILVPHDFSDTSTAALNYGIELARKFGAQLSVLHVGNQARSDLDTEFPLGLHGSIEDGVRERLVKILTPAQQTEFKPEFSVRAGMPASEIVQYAKEQTIDLIVMGTHGRGFMGHAVMGSVAEKVVRAAPCPVLTVRNPPQHQFVTADEVAVKTLVSA
jgi:nucleotide-binding universal stress UspA family protein